MTQNQMKITTPTEREIEITREFDAPRRLVFEALTRPERMARWLNGPPGWETTACEVDLRPGGAFRHAWRGPDGVEMAMHGVFREVVAPERIVRTETFEFGCSAQGGEQIGTAVLTEQRGRTTLVITLLYPSKEVRDAALASGMEHGMSAGYARLDELLSEETRTARAGT